jgi:hypothetical protein
MSPAQTKTRFLASLRIFAIMHDKIAAGFYLGVRE